MDVPKGRNLVMDLNALMGTLLSGDTIANMSQKTGASGQAVQNVLASALPALLNGAQAQANGSDTAESFVNALAQHAQDDTHDLSAFVQNIDMEDGAKIVSHLLGNQQTEITQTASQRAGLSSGSTGLILAAAAPLLMSLLGQQTNGSQNNNAAGIGSLLGSMLGGADTTSLIGALLGGGMGQAQPQAQAIPQVTPLTNTAASNNQQKESTGLLGFLGKLFSGLLK